MVARKSKTILVQGIVQGVGFRPFIYNLANSLSIDGYVCNTGLGVEIKLVANKDHIVEFLERMQSELPILAEITDVLEINNSNVLATHTDGNQETDKGFKIVTSHAKIKGEVRIPADVKMCADCQNEINDIQDRHYYYPLTNCTNCGPRYTVIRDVPYDRPYTAMNEFQMCSACQAEYEQPSDRRFHAQPTACPLCGPSFSLLDKQGSEMIIAKNSNQYLMLFQKVAAKIDAGQILAIKGVGGFHFVCDANNHTAVKRLRESKQRPYKPLAVMAKTLAAAQKRLYLSDLEIELLTSSAAPIVILDKKKEQDLEQIAPSLNSVGVMLPYAPVHQLLFNHLQTEWLVMTSANPSNMPITINNQQAITELAIYVDGFVIHEREIIQSCDDSIVRVINNRATMIRRGRGYTPAILTAPMSTQSIMVSNQTASSKPTAVMTATILAVGGEMKNQIAYMRGDKIILSQHIGEIDSLEGRQHFLSVAGHLERLFDIEPQIVAYDKHPSYQISEIARLLPYQHSYQIQHHHAHMASCMAEHQLQGQVLGIILDGTGYGDDDKLWGCEFLAGDYSSFQRLAQGDYLPIVGGERAIREPWRMAVAMLHHANSQTVLQHAQQMWPSKINEIKILQQLLQKNIQVTASSGMGRLFDGIAAILGMCNVSSYEGEAAIRLSAAAERALMRQNLWHDRSFAKRIAEKPRYSVKIIEDSNQLVLDWKTLISNLTEDVLALSVKRNNNKQSTKEDTDIIALAFIDSLIYAIVELSIKLTIKNNIQQVVLSGGTWHNEVMLETVCYRLARAGLRVYYQQQLPTNDGGIALGQAVIAAANINDERGNKICV